MVIITRSRTSEGVAPTVWAMVSNGAEMVVVVTAMEAEVDIRDGDAVACTIMEVPMEACITKGLHLVSMASQI